MGRLGSWFANTFGAAPQDAPADTMEVVFEGPHGECQVVALRLKQAGFFVDPDPTARINGFGSGRSNLGFATRNQNVSAITVSVLATDADAARRLLEDVEPI